MHPTVSILLVTTIVASGQQLKTPEWTEGFFRTIYPNAAYQRQYCLEDGLFGDRPEPMNPFNSFQMCSIGQIRFAENVTPAPSISLGDIGNVCSAVVDMGTFATLRTAYNVNYQNDALWASIQFDESSALWSILSSPSTTQPLIVNGLNTTQTSNSFLPVAGHVYLFRLTSGNQNTISAGNLMFGRLLASSVSSDRIDLNWVVLWPQPCASNPCGIYAQCQPIYPNGATPYAECKCLNGEISKNCGRDGRGDFSAGVSPGAAAGISFGMSLLVLFITGVCGYCVYRRSGLGSASTAASLPASSAPTYHAMDAGAAGYQVNSAHTTG